MSPRATKRCSRRDCDEPMPCPTHKPIDRRVSRHEREYGSEHERRAQELRARATEANLACGLCDEPIDYRLRTPHPMSFAAHHLTRDKSGPIVQTHKVCNERAGQPSA